MTALLSRRHVILALAGVALVLVTYPHFAWSLSPEHFFRADDWDWLSNAALLRVPGYADLWPRWIYNDRPAGALLITAVYRLAGLDNVVFHGVWVAIHLLNTLLVFAAGLRLFRSIPLAWVAACAFGNWSSSTEAVVWVAAVFDLLLGTFILASVLTFLSEKNWVRALSPVFYFLAMRTKEAALLLPVLLLICVLLCVSRNNWLSECFHRLKWHFCLLGMFIARYGYFFATQYAARIPPDNPYFLKFDLLTFIRGLTFYLRSMLYRQGRIPVLVLAAGAALLIVLVVARRGKAVVIGAAGFVLFLFPVIFLPNHRYGFYLYAPSVFFAISWVGLAREAAELIRWPRARAPLAAAVALGSFLALPHRTAARQTANWTLEQTARYRQQYRQFRWRYPVLSKGARIVFVGFPRNDSAFDPGPCNSLKAAYRDDSISCVMLKEGDPIPPVEPARPDTIYVVLRSGRLEFPQTPDPSLPPVLLSH
jgi:hypothetical protein